MEIKCGRRTFDCTDKDLILDNGSCYQIITKKYFKDWYDYTPVLSKTLFKKLLKEGKIRKSKKRHATDFPSQYFNLYEFIESEE